MKDALGFVSKAISPSCKVPTLKNFYISGGRVMGGNGEVFMSAPIDLAEDIQVCPAAAPLIQALKTATGQLIISLTASGRLLVQGDGFKAFINTSSDEYPFVEPEGEGVDLPEGFIGPLSAVEPFICRDSYRPWAHGVLIDGQSMWALNNIIVVEQWVPFVFPVKVNLPLSTVQILLNIGEEPERLQVTTSSVTFHYSGGRWIRSTLYPSEWPEVADILNRECNPVPVPEGLAVALKKLTPFVDKELGAEVHFAPNSIGSHESAEEGAHVEIEGLPHMGIYNASMMALMLKAAKTADFSLYPAPVLFFGDAIRGAFVGKGR